MRKINQLTREQVEAAIKEAAEMNGEVVAVPKGSLVDVLTAYRDLRWPAKALKPVLNPFDPRSLRTPKD
jgi:hypothetical protein